MVDSYKVLNCPACGEKMKKIFIPEYGFHVDICENGCGGIFLDNKELKMMNEQHKHLDDDMKNIENADYSHANIDETAERICPACGAKMVKNPTSANGSIIIDECYNCGGKFFDHGKLTKYRLEYPTEQERSEAAMKIILNSAHINEKNYLSKTLDILNHRILYRGFSSIGRILSTLFRKF